MSSYIGRLETRLLAVEELLAASLVPNRSANSPNHGSRTSDDDLPSPYKRRRGQISEEQLQVPAACVGDTVIELRNGHLEEDAGDAPDTVVDGMGAVVVGDEEDYGYFGMMLHFAKGSDGKLTSNPRSIVEHRFHWTRHSGSRHNSDRPRRNS